MNIGVRMEITPPDLVEGDALPEGDDAPEVSAFPDPAVKEGIARGVDIPTGRVGVPSTPVKVRADNGSARDLQAFSNSSA